MPGLGWCPLAGAWGFRFFNQEARFFLFAAPAERDRPILGELESNDNRPNSFSGSEAAVALFVFLQRNNRVDLRLQASTSCEVDKFSKSLGYVRITIGVYSIAG